MAERNETRETRSSEQTEHERMVAEIERTRAGTGSAVRPEAPEEADGETGPTPYDREVAVERTGRDRTEVEDEVRDDERNPLDAGYGGGRTG